MNTIQTIQVNDQEFAALGNPVLLDQPKIGLLCSRKCPAARILEAHGFFKQWAADAKATIISGFHSPVEKECLNLLLKGKANIIFCPAREIEHMRMPSDWKSALAAGRMLILSPYTEKRADNRTIDRRNQLVAALADELYIPYATPGGNLAHFEKMA
jgi:predicted Rossmann fold nucleotide-binding protein DprA/Smf involved in DNA uptake